MNCGIYEILNTVNNKRYIGSSKTLKSRLSEHKRLLKKNQNPCKLLQRAWNKYGEESFVFKILTICEEKDLNFYEDLIIKGYKSNQKEFGYNTREVSDTNRGMLFPKRTKHESGDVYNRLTLVEPAYMKGDRHHWLCKCACGNSVITDPIDVRKGHTKSCGCLNIERRAERLKKWNKENGPWNKGKKISDTVCN